MTNLTLELQWVQPLQVGKQMHEQKEALRIKRLINLGVKGLNCWQAL